MDSINKNQQETNHQDLMGKDSVKKIKELIDKASVCFFCTNINTDKSFVTRPMSALETDGDGNIWFLSAADSKKNKAIEEGNTKVQLLFQGSSHTDFLTVYGNATITTDKTKIKELWKPLIKAWFTEGENDPRITVIKIAPKEGYYWDTKHGAMIAFAKIVAGAIMGKTMDDSIEGKISL